MMKRQEKAHFRCTETRLPTSHFHRAAFWEIQFISGLGKMAGVQPPPLRNLDDFLMSSARFAVPDVRDLDRWNNRMINNLLYYQSNYFLSALSFLLLVGCRRCWGFGPGLTLLGSVLEWKMLAEVHLCPRRGAVRGPAPFFGEV
ncbi:PREDICTED: uncharacterized protein LOC106912033 isoform X1 [Poecilia mexicana]|uniref:uncharacterized protein LOC106912033 isoform X1 n=1 Tax=Poecilia mexicana TaxID=48701 RepID=UPI00072DAFE5|nr:PREDICTED: uncharacterized protein LOC106912033 isoform X1 [Poecilia mexicana]